MAIKTLIKYRAFVRDFGLLSGGRALTVLASVISLPFLTRLYHPEEFGILGLVLAYTNILQVILSLRYEMAIFRAENEVAANTICIATLGIGVLFSFLVYLGFLGFNSFFGFISPSKLIHLIMLVTLFSTLAKVFEARLERHQSYGVNTFVNISAALTTIAAQLIFQHHALGLVWGYMTGEGLRFLLGISFSLRLLRRYDLSKAWELLVRFKKFPFFAIPASFFNQLSAQLPVFILEGTLGAASVGLFTVLNRVTLMPVSLIATNLNRIVYQRLSKKVIKQQAVSHEMRLAAGGATAVGIAIATVFVILAYVDGFALILGKKWAVLDSDIIYLVPGMCMQLVATSVARFALFDRQEVGLVYQALRVVIVGLAVGMSALAGFGFDQVMMSLGGAMFLLAAIQVAISFQLAKQYELSLGKTSLKPE